MMFYLSLHYLQNCASQLLLPSYLVITYILINSSRADQCSALLAGQYICDDPVIDPLTQQAFNCSKKERTVQVACYPSIGIQCDNKVFNGSAVGFYKSLDCRWTNGYKFDTALLLSIFGGFLGLDRFYLGYAAVGCLKLFTLGFMGFGWLIDIILIAIQILLPSDGSAYICPYFGPGATPLTRNNDTYLYIQD